MVHSSMNIRKLNSLPKFSANLAELIFTFIALHRLLKNYQGDHNCSQLQANTNLHTCGFKTFTTSNHIAESRAFYDVKFDHVTSQVTNLFMEL